MPRKKRYNKRRPNKVQVHSNSVNNNSQNGSFESTQKRDVSQENSLYEMMISRVPPEMLSFITYQAILDNMLKQYFKQKNASTFHSVKSIVNMLIETEVNNDFNLGEYGLNLTQLVILFCDCAEIKKLIIERNADVDLIYQDLFGLFSGIQSRKGNVTEDAVSYSLFDLFKFRMMYRFSEVSNEDVVTIVKLLDECSDMHRDLKNQKCRFIADAISEGSHDIPYYQYLTTQEYVGFECKVHRFDENLNKKLACCLGLFEFALLNGNIVAATKLIPFIEINKIGSFDVSIVRRYFPLEMERALLSSYILDFQDKKPFNIYDVLIFSVRHYEIVQIEEIQHILDLFKRHKLFPLRYANIDIEEFITEIKQVREIFERLKNIKTDSQPKPHLNQFERVKQIQEQPLKEKMIQNRTSDSLNFKF